MEHRPYIGGAKVKQWLLGFEQAHHIAMFYQYTLGQVAGFINLTGIGAAVSGVLC